MATEIMADIPKDSSEGTYLDERLFQKFLAFDIERQHHAVQFCNNQVLRDILKAFHVEVMMNISNIRELDDTKLANEYKILRMNLLLVQDLIGFLDKVSQHLTNEFPGLNSEAYQGRNT